MKKYAFLASFLCLFSNAFSQDIPFADIHSHVCLKAFHSRSQTDYDNWDKIEHDCSGEHKANWIVKASKGVPTYSQANLEANVFGKESSCAASKRAPSVNPAVKEAPIAM